MFPRQNSKATKRAPSHQNQFNGSSALSRNSSRAQNKVSATMQTLTSEIPNETASFRFRDLPNELQLGAVSYLTAKEVQQARRVNKHVCSLIDQNQNTVTEPVRARALARLEHDFEHIIGFDIREVDIFEALKRIVNHNHRLGYTDSRQSAWRALDQLCSYKTGKPADQGPLKWFIYELLEIQNHALTKVATSQMKTWEWAKSVSREFENDSKSMQVGAAKEGWSYEYFHHEPLDSLVDSITVEVEDFGYSKEDVEKWCKEVFEHGTLRHCHNEVWQREPQYELPSEMLEQAFGLPAIPTVLAGIGYCVRTKWASRRACDAFIDGKPMSEVEKAAILEDVFIY